MLDILVYLFEHFEELGSGDQHASVLHSEPLSETLIEAGFEREEIDEAFGWLAGLSNDRYREFSAPSPGAVRVFTDQEYEHLGHHCLNYLFALEKQNAVPAALRELIIDRAMAMDDLSLDHFKIIVLIVLWSRNHAVDSLLVETLLDNKSGLPN